MSKIMNIAGERYGNLTVLSLSEPLSGMTAWLCQCDCGKQKVIKATYLRTGDTKSCGCQKSIKIAAARTKHGMIPRGQKRPPEYRSWAHMKYRCNSPTSPKYPIYGARGIKVCDRWNDSFADFYKDMGPKPAPEYTIDRIDNNGNYEPSNCRWATKKQQSRNQSRTVLNDAMVDFIRSAPKEMTNRDIMNAIGGTIGAISAARDGKTWIG